MSTTTLPARSGRGRRKPTTKAVIGFRRGCVSTNIAVVQGNGLVATRFLAKGDVLLAKEYEAVRSLPPSAGTPKGEWKYIAAMAGSRVLYFDLCAPGGGGSSTQSAGECSTSLFHINDARPRANANVKWALWRGTGADDSPILSLKVRRPIEKGHELLVAYDPKVEGQDTTDEDERQGEGDEETEEGEGDEENNTGGKA